MGSIDSHIAAVLGGQAYQTAENASSPPAQPANAAPPASAIPVVSVFNSQQDRVSLSGTIPPPQQQQSAPLNGTARPAAFALLPQEITFPPGQSTADVFTTSTFPAASTPAGPNSVSDVVTPSTSNSAAANAIETSALQTAVGTESPVAAVAANAAATASPASASNTAPAQQTLQQLDRALQQLGIDPQSLSLISRGGMLNWINDPAALRQIVQNVRSAANPLQQTAAVGAAKPEQNTLSSSSQPADSTNTNALNQSAATAQQNAAAMMQFQKLQNSLAPRGVHEASPAANPSATPTPQGQLLNVSV
jgi:hypothetical protein